MTIEKVVALLGKVFRAKDFPELEIHRVGKARPRQQAIGRFTLGCAHCFFDFVF